MKKLLAFIRRAPKRTSAVLTMIAAAVIVPLALNAWGPSANRPLFSIKNPADYVTFNSITDNPVHGFEPNFMQIREATADNSTYADSIALQAGKEYVVYMYYHNNAKTSLNASGVGIAQGARIEAKIPAIVPNGSTNTAAMGYVSATNATPGSVYDDIFFKNTTGGDISLRYVPGSATIHSKGAINGKTLPDSIVSGGTALGYNALDGIVPGCNEYAGYVTFRVKADQPNFTVSKQVKLNGTSGWKENIAANPGDTVDYLIEYKNTGTMRQNNVTIKDKLPAGMTYVAGSAKYYNSFNPNGAPATDDVTGKGLNIGNYEPGANGLVRFSAKLPSASTLKCGINKFVNTGIVETDNGWKQDDATVETTKECPPEPPKPKYTCDGLSVKKLERTKFEFSAAYTVENATFKSITYVVRNAAGAEIYRGPNNVYTQTTPGTYSVQAIVIVTVNGEDKEATGDKCKATFTVDQPPVVPKYSCDSLTVKKLERTKFEFTTAYTVENATFKHVTYVVRNASGTEVSRSQNATFTTETLGKYTAEALVTVTVNGEDKTVTNPKCKREFEVTQASNPKVTIDKKVDGVEHKKVAVNQEFTYQIVVKNTGNIDLTKVKVTDNAPANVQFISADKGTIVDNKWSYEIAELKVGQSASFAIKAKATKEDLQAVKNTACVDAPQVPGNPDDCDDATIETPKKPVAKYTCDGLSVKKLERTKFEFSAAYTVENATFKHVTYVVRNAAGSELYRGATPTYTQTTPGSYSVQAIITVTVNGEDKTVTSDKCKATFKVDKEKTPSVSINKKVDGVEHKIVKVGQEFAYQITVKNNGEIDLSKVTVTDNAPQFVEFIRADKGEIKDNKWSYTIPELKVGESASFVITAKATKEVDGKIKNTACVDAPQVPGNPDDCDDATVEVPKTPVVPTIEVCDLTTKKVVTIKETDFDSDKYSKDLSDCAETPVVPPVTPEIPTELPTTGISDTAMAVVGLGSLITSISYYVVSRRALGA